MKQLFVLLAACLAAASLNAQTVEAGFTSLFNGKDLSGWAGRTNHWSVEGGAITGVTSADNPAQGNNFLLALSGTTNLVVGDFELRFAYRFLTPQGNSGVQYRSRDQGNHVVHGYQADMEAGPNYTGILYEEGGRGILALRGQKVRIAGDPERPGKPKIEITGALTDSKTIQAAIKVGDWNDYVIIAKGNRLQHFVNGLQTVEVVDDQADKAAQAGVLALQVHVGPPMKVQFRNVRLRRL
jgi:hypothetical protein